MINAVMKAFPVVAILRGIQPDEVVAIGNVLYESGVRCIEVPLNSPTPFGSIRLLADSMPDDCLVGAGTVLTAEDVIRVKQAGGKLIVTPNIFEGVICRALDEGMEIAPGFATASEAFDAIRLGVSVLKLFPASTYGSSHLRALRAVLPENVKVLAVGGIGAEDFAEWQAAGTVGFGIGSELYKAGDSPAVVAEKIGAMRALLPEY